MSELGLTARQLQSVSAVLAGIAARLEQFDNRLAPELSDDCVSVVEPAGGGRVELRVANDGRGAVKLVAAAVVDRGTARVLGSTLGRQLGMVQVLPIGETAEVRRWSPYRVDDLDRTPMEAVDWAASTAEVLLQELRLRSRVSAPVSLPVSPPNPEPEQFHPAPAPVAVPVAAEVIERAVSAQLAAATERAVVAERALAEARDLVEARAADVRGLEDALAAVMRERDLARATLEARPEAGALATGLVDPVPALEAAFTLIVDGGARPSTCIEVLNRFLEIAPGAPALREHLGIALLRDDRVPQAVDTLSSLGADGLSPRGAGALVEACLRKRVLPDPLDILARVDWRMGSSAQQLKDLPTWAPQDRLLEIAELLSYGSPPEYGTFLGSLARLLPVASLERLHQLWSALDTAAATDQLLDWVQAGRVQMSQSWVRTKVADAVYEDDRRTVRRAIDILADDAEHRQSAPDLLAVIATGKDLMRLADWRTWALSHLSEAVSLASDPVNLEQCSTHLLDLLRDVPSLREDDPLHHLAVRLERRLDGDTRVILVAEIERLKPQDITVRDVTTVSEALRAAKERFPALLVLADAERSAAKRGTKAVAKARESLFALGELATRYTAGELDEGLNEALATLPGYKPGISDTAKNQYTREYLKALPDGGKIMLGPHIDIGGEEGRAYFAIDAQRKRIVLGHLGHLSGKQDT